MRIIPVIDLKGGLVVRGIGGRRDEYQPVRSILTDGASPSSVARAFAHRLRSRLVYVADLDAIAGGPCDWQSYDAIRQAGLNLWLDAGVGSAERARQLAADRRCGETIEHVIVGLESLEHRAARPEIVSILGPGGTVFSLDLKRGVPITRCPEWQVTSDRGSNTVPGGEVVRSGDTLHGADVAIDEIIAAVLGAGVRRLIVLDLAGVGVGAGVQALDVCRRAAQAAAAADVRLELVSGGGVRNVDDLAAMAHAGCSAALVASALHDGRIRADDLAALGE